MSNNRLNIAIMVYSDIIYEGLYTVLTQSNLNCTMCKVSSLEDFQEIIHSKSVDILITNPMQLVNRTKEVRKLKSIQPTLSIIGINMGIIDNDLKQVLDDTFTVYDSVTQVINKLIKSSENSENKNSTFTDNLTEREIDVLIKLAHGLSNKEIADALNISIHTVVTHRKNLSAKTGIRSQSGLTIYAISKKIISIDDIDLKNG